MKEVFLMSVSGTILIWAETVYMKAKNTEALRVSLCFAFQVHFVHM